MGIILTVKITHDTSLAGYTSLRVGGRAETLIEIEKADNLADVIARSVDGLAWLLGFGTNCLISDKGLPGVVIVNRSGRLEKMSPTRFKVGSGLNWDDFIQAIIADDLWGLEFTSGIPGGSGAAVAGNIAAYGHKVADSFIQATIINPLEKRTEIWDRSKLEFDYRDSAVQRPENSHLVILDATFELSPEPTGELQYESALKVAHELGLKPDSLANRRKIIIETRQRAGSLLTNPAAGPWTAGSFFKNPRVDEAQIQAIIEHEEKPISRQQLLRQNVIHGQDKNRVSAAHVLLAAGFKRGQSWGNVRLHPHHILKLENMGSATASEMYDVVQQIIQTVKEKLDIKLEPEVRFLGDF